MFLSSLYTSVYNITDTVTTRRDGAAGIKRCFIENHGRACVVCSIHNDMSDNQKMSVDENYIFYGRECTPSSHYKTEHLNISRMNQTYGQDSIFVTSEDGEVLLFIFSFRPREFNSSYRCGSITARKPR